MKTMKSPVWDFFTTVPNQDKVASCNLCKLQFSYRSTSGNLRKHMAKKHPHIRIKTIKTVSNKICLTEIGASSSTDATSIDCLKQQQAIKEDIDMDDLEPSTSMVSPSILDSQLSTSSTSLDQPEFKPFLQTPSLGSYSRERIDEKLLLLFTKDFQPFSIVEDSGFMAYTEALNQSYKLPSKKTITNSLLPAAYEEAYNEIKQTMINVRAITLTTDCWRSENGENYFAVTGHFITDSFRLKSALLDCVCLPDKYTTEDFASTLKKVINEWQLKNKILIVISDKTKNLVKAVEENLQLNHLPCYAHTVNLIGKNALEIEALGLILEKLKQIVGHFKRNTLLMSKLIEQQKLLNQDPRKLIQSNSMGWNSTFYMIQRLVELEEPLRLTMASIDKDFLTITDEEWRFLKNLCEILEPLENLTRFISGDYYNTASSIIILTDGLSDVYQNLRRKIIQETSSPTILCEVIDKILEEIKVRLVKLEHNNSLTVSTLLDPRYKSVGFSSNIIGDKAKKKLTSLLTQIIDRDVEMPLLDVVKTEANIENTNIWDKFDKKRNSIIPVGTAHSKALIEIQRYLEEPTISRMEDPMVWWQNNSYNFPNLCEVFKDNFIPVGTSVPCERLFSKSGQLLLERRNRISAGTVKPILFLNSLTLNSE